MVLNAILIAPASAQSLNNTTTANMPVTQVDAEALEKSLAGDCLASQSYLEAQYTIHQYSLGGPLQKGNFVLWRHGDTIAHQHPDTGIVESWHHTSGRHTKRTRFFDQHERSIEFDLQVDSPDQAMELREKRRQLLSNRVLQQLQPKPDAAQETGLRYGCASVELLQGVVSGSQMNVEWLTGWQLPSSLFVKMPDGVSTRLTLQSLNTDASSIKAAMAKRDAYFSTDHADIGDNESDPFLLQMMNLGFIDGGASGMYDLHGHPIAGGHSHGGVVRQ